MTEITLLGMTQEDLANERWSDVKTIRDEEAETIVDFVDRAIRPGASDDGDQSGILRKDLANKRGEEAETIIIIHGDTLRTCPQTS